MGLIKKDGRWIVEGADIASVTEDSATKVVLAPKKKKSKIKEGACWNLARSVLASADATRVLLYGPPGTGKTSLGFSINPNCYSITLHDDSTVESLLGMYMPKGSEFVFVEGPAPRAMREGKPLILNEIIEAAGPVLTKLYEILDDPSVLRLTLPTGEIVIPAAGFKVVATMNGDPNNLPEPLKDRFDAIILIDSPSAAAVESLPEDLHDIVVSMYSNPDNIAASFRQFKGFAMFRTFLGEEEAGKMKFGKQWGDIKASLKLGKREA